MVDSTLILVPGSKVLKLRILNFRLILGKFPFLSYQLIGEFLGALRAPRIIVSIFRARFARPEIDPKVLSKWVPSRGPGIAKNPMKTKGFA